MHEALRTSWRRPRVTNWRQPTWRNRASARLPPVGLPNAIKVWTYLRIAAGILESIVGKSGICMSFLDPAGGTLREDATAPGYIGIAVRGSTELEAGLYAFPCPDEFDVARLKSKVGVMTLPASPATSAQRRVTTFSQLVAVTEAQNTNVNSGPPHNASGTPRAQFSTIAQSLLLRWNGTRWTGATWRKSGRYQVSQLSPFILRRRL